MLKLNQGISSLQTKLEKTLLTLSKLHYQQQYEVGGIPEIHITSVVGG